METKATIQNVHTSGSQLVPAWLRPVARWTRVIAMVAAGAVSLGGCAAELSPAVDAPVGYESYPSAYYDGHVTYYVDGRWYFPRGDRWYYYQRVPATLARQRPVYVHPRGARPAYVHPGYGRGGGPGPAYEAPPAHRPWR